jgi:uncharacterized membrane protein YadS
VDHQIHCVYAGLGDPVGVRSISGVSAAIAAAGAVLAKKEEITYITAPVIVTALPMMVLMPCAEALGMSWDVAGAWFGSNIDTTAAAVGAGTIHSEEALSVVNWVILGALGL